MQTLCVKSMRFNCVYFVVPKYWKAIMCSFLLCPVDEVRLLLSLGQSHLGVVSSYHPSIGLLE